MKRLPFKIAYRFHCYDWSEILYAMGLNNTEYLKTDKFGKGNSIFLTKEDFKNTEKEKFPEWARDDLVLERFIAFLWENTSYDKWARQDKEAKMFMKICRKYANTFAKVNPLYSRPIFEGLASIEDDETFFRYFTILIGWMDF